MISTMMLAAGLGALGQLPPLAHEGSLTEGLHSPARISVAPDDSVLVTDPASNHVVHFDAAGVMLGTITVPEGPVGIASHPDGRYFVSLRDEPKVAVYDAAFTRTGFLGEGNPLVSFVAPTDLAVAASSGHVYVTDSAGDRVYGFDATGALALIFGSHGESNGQFQYPSAVAVDPANDRLLVADHDNFRVQVFTSAGVFTQRFGYRIKYLVGGGDEGWMPRTQGLAVDAAGNAYVADAFMSTVRIFDPTGLELGKVVTYGSAAGDLRTPCDLALSNDGAKLYVVSTNTSSVEIYTAATLGAVAAARWEIEPFETATAGTNRSHYDVARRLGLGNRRTDGSPIKRATREPGTRHGTVESGSTAADAIPGYDGPHMIDSSVICGRCHGIPAQPGDNPSTTEGQQTVCFSCHAGGGQGLTMPLHELDKTGIPARSGRTHAWGVPAINAAVGSVGPPAGSLLKAYLDGGNIKCATCHDQHTSEAGAPYLRAPNANGAMCRQCHVDHIGHTPSGSWQPTCVECHDMHDVTSENLSLVAPVVVNQTLGTDAAVLFEARTGPNSFDDGDPAANDGICQVCHTATTYHRHDGTGAAHNDGTTCTDCHPHDTGFMPVGGDCTSCHASPQDNGDGLPAGGRRAVVGEFPIADAHAHYGATLDSGACTVCHDVTTHMNGYVELLDPDGGALYSFVRPEDLTSDPDLSDFCAGCHDADGATRLASPFDPFGNGNAPPDVDAKFAGTLQWNQMYGDSCFGNEGTLRGVNSHHDISDTDQLFSGAKLECINCHGAHNASASQPTADPFDTTTAWAGSGNDFCLSCHGGGAGPLDPGFPTGVVWPVIDPTDPGWATLGFDWTTILGGACLTSDCSSLRGIDSCDYVPGPWYVDHSWTHSAHGLDSKRGWDGYSGAPGADMPCMDCHDPHGSATVANPAGNPYMIRDTVDGTAYVDDGTRTGGFNGPPFETFGTTRDVTVTISGTSVDWGSNVSLCSTCHANWQAAYSWHDFCTGCQTCHAHGALAGELDFVGSNSTSCPVPATAPNWIGEPLWGELTPMKPDDTAPAPAPHRWNAGWEGLRPEMVQPTNGSSAVHEVDGKK